MCWGAMAIELPGELVWVINLIGVNWPQVNEDKVREFAGHVREFGRSVDATHQAAGETIRQLGEHYQADSYEQLVAAWGCARTATCPSWCRRASSPPPRWRSPPTASSP
ncbi:hypothetical protein ACFQZC_16050 [Streptacidiphilus monticola]